MKSLHSKFAQIFIISLMSLSGYTNTVFASEDHEHEHEEHGHEEGHSEATEISSYYIQASGIKSEDANAQSLIQTDTLFGVIAPVQDQVFSLHAAFPSMIEKVYVQVGDKVKEGQVIARLTNIQTLQSYTLKSPSKGEVTSRSVNTGDRVDAEEILQVSDLSKVWVNMSAFPESIERLAKGQAVNIYDLHDHENSVGKISYIAPKMSGGHIARARAIIDNSEGHWRPGMHVKADVQVSSRQAAIAVKVDAVQTMEGKTVIFKRHDNQFEATQVELGERDDQWIEILSGIEAGTHYVSENSFLVKADILKSGASHDH